MKVKLDENLGTRGAALLREAGHDVATVVEQGLFSASDRAIIVLCREERRCLVTLDLEFGNPLLFKPSDYAGIAILHLPPKPNPEDLLDAVRTLIGGLAGTSIEGMLWIVQRERIRVYQEERDTNNE